MNRNHNSSEKHFFIMGGGPDQYENLNPSENV